MTSKDKELVGKRVIDVKFRREREKAVLKASSKCLMTANRIQK